MDNDSSQPSQLPGATIQKLPPIPKGATIRRRPIPSGPVASTTSARRIHVSAKTPFRSVTTRVRKQLDKHLRQSASSRSAFTNKLSQKKNASLGERVRRIQEQSQNTATGGLGLGLENSGEVLVLGTGRAIQKVAEVALFFKKQPDCIVQLRTGSLAAVDDVVSKEEDGLEGDVAERARMPSSSGHHQHLIFIPTKQPRSRTMASPPQPPSYIIVGARVFGVSTALHLVSQYPGADVTLIDRHDPNAPIRPAASWDWNKVIRADYRDLTYCQINPVALEAQDEWRTNPLWNPFYHETGIYWISRTGFAQKVVDNFKALGRDAEIYALPVQEARQLYGGIFDNADFEGVDKVLINKTSGWAAAKDALQAGIEKAISLGVKYITAEVDQLEFDDETRCVGVKTENGSTITADRTVLCTGAFTPALLEKTATSTSRDALRPEKRMIAAGVTTGLVDLDERTAELFKEMPVCIQENPIRRGPSNGTLPPNRKNQIKFWGQSIFQFLQGAPVYSQPPAAADYKQWEVPEPLKADVAVANEATFGKCGANWKIHTHRICWDCVTPSEDFIISQHPASAGLFIATCGSFHGWKFLPVIGRYVVQMLEGTLESDLEQRWAWDRPLPNDSEVFLGNDLDSACPSGRRKHSTSVTARLTLGWEHQGGWSRMARITSYIFFVPKPAKMQHRRHGRVIAAAAALFCFQSCTACATIKLAAPASVCSNVTSGQTYDYIIVGSGAGGIPLADRLTAAGHTVLLIEKGPPSTGLWGGNLKPTWLNETSLTRFDVPGLANEIWHDPTGVVCTDVDQMSGCVLGGGVAVNSGWKSRDVAAATGRVFDRIPGTTTPSMDGKLYLQQGFEMLTSGLAASGWKSVVPNDHPDQKNFTYGHATHMFSNGERGGPLATYLLSASKRKEFTLWMNTTAKRVVRTRGHATGVEINCSPNADGHAGVVSITPGTGRVILSAGAFGSAKLLFRSGIGPTDQLNIVKNSTDGPTMISSDSWINLPVGYNLDDHVGTDIEVAHPSVVFYDFYGAYSKPIVSDTQAYLANRTGILAQAAPNLGPIFWEIISGTDGVERHLHWQARVEGTTNTSMTITQYLGTGSTTSIPIAAAARPSGAFVGAAAVGGFLGLVAML
ncbi:hypothetical protein NUW58_g4598 [Xylaria curta]|uniref:Uncharacterized protein n=1 Tax=Xylaria curta TaxID=42375 RepID=A0ACC1P5Q2_9PEZI|nr:hypothetical protein NUW58_g4598 [Xylaria curta]